MKSQLIILLAILIQVGCNTKKKESNDPEMAGHDMHSPEHGISNAAVTELMAIHDSIMPRTSDIMKLKSSISAEIQNIDSLNNLKPDTKLEARKKLGISLNAKLDQADQAMMEWMHQYKADTLEKLNEQQISVYISDQKLKIENVRGIMNSAIEDATLFIGKK